LKPKKKKTSRPKGKATSRRKKRKPKKKSVLRRVLLPFFKLAILGLFAFVLFFTSVYLGFWGPLPTALDLTRVEQAKATLIKSSEGELLAKIYSQNREPLTYEAMPQHLRDALTATEDERFYQHDGVDYRSLVRVLFKSIILRDRRAGGGSTITQQLAKNLFGRPDFSWFSMPVNKVKEIIIARRFESIYSKDEIITLYLNTVSFSENTYGIASGSLRFFNRMPSKLKLEESAVLIGLLKANTYYNPRINPEPALIRRNTVLAQMARSEKLSIRERDSLQALPLKLSYRNLDRESPAAYFSAKVKRELTNILSDKLRPDGREWQIETDGLIVTTTLQSQLHTTLKTAALAHLSQLQNKFDKHWSSSNPWASNKLFFDQKLAQTTWFKRRLSRGLSEEAIYKEAKVKRDMRLYHPAGFLNESISIEDSLSHYLKLLRLGSVAIDPQTGAVRAWLGGSNFRYLPYDNVLAPKPTASTFKPLVFALALEKGDDPCTYQSAERRVYPDFNNWSPRNYDDSYEGYFSMTGALKKSINTVTVKWLMEHTEEELVYLARKMGIEEKLPEGPSIALGTGSASPLEMAVVYACFANGGYKIEPYLIDEVRAPNGDIIYKHLPKSKERVISANTAQLMNYMLQQVVKDGTAASLSWRYGVKDEWAGKTGTSQNYADAWFVGYNDALVMSTWVGGENSLIRFRNGSLGSGSAMALPVFGATIRDYKGKDLRRNQWNSLDSNQRELLGCADWREANIGEKLLDLLDKVDDEVRDDEKDGDGSWWNRLFKKKKD
jgi:penicillin-binding protein 1A